MHRDVACHFGTFPFGLSTAPGVFTAGCDPSWRDAFDCTTLGAVSRAGGLPLLVSDCRCLGLDAVLGVRGPSPAVCSLRGIFLGSAFLASGSVGDSQRGAAPGGHRIDRFRRGLGFQWTSQRRWLPGLRMPFACTSPTTAARFPPFVLFLRWAGTGADSAPAPWTEPALALFVLPPGWIVTCAPFELCAGTCGGLLRPSDGSS